MDERSGSGLYVITCFEFHRGGYFVTYHRFIGFQFVCEVCSRGNTLLVATVVLMVTMMGCDERWVHNSVERLRKWVRFRRQWKNPGDQVFCWRPLNSKSEYRLISSMKYSSVLWIPECVNVYWTTATRISGLFFDCPNWGISVLFLSCKANTRVYITTTGHGPHFPIYFLFFLLIVFSL
jgi:hypothetical protein